jgi:signal transduction histidine kinase
MTTASVALAAALGLTVDTVLLVALAERRNRTARQTWMVCLAASAWCWHAGAAGYFLLEAQPPNEVHHWRWAAMTLMVAGLLGMPCSLLHAVVRLATSGWFGPPQRRGYEPLLYAPVLLTVPIALSLGAPSEASFLERVDLLVVPYLWAVTVISLIAASVIRAWADVSGLPAGPRFLRLLSATLFAMTALLLFVMVVALDRWPEVESWWLVILVLLPLPPAVLFAYFVLRYGFLPLVLERTLVYGGILAGLVLVHRSLVAPLEDAWGNHSGANLLVLEIALGAALVLGYPPTRRRVREAARYLTSGTVHGFRREVRALSVELAAHAGRVELLAWFVQELVRIPGIAAAQIVVTELPRGLAWERSSEPLCPPDVAARLQSELADVKAQALFADQAPTRWAAEELLRARVTVVIRTDYEGLHNLWLLRAAPGGEVWGEEELNTLVLLAEQWTGAVRHSVLQAARAAAERRAWQAEKLSSLGLLAGSLAHEIKNPLSSIKTLTTVALEESDPDSEHAQSLRLVLKEIERLSQTTQQLLAFVRSGAVDAGVSSCDAGDVVQATVQIVGHRARQQQVALHWEPPETAVRLRAPREALQSVLLNLVLNAVEACPHGGTVSIDCAANGDLATLSVRDTGPGIPPEIQDRLFQPLTTTKADGTGLGLYSAAQTVRDLGGDVSVESAPGRGTVFRVTLPLADDPRL